MFNKLLCFPTPFKHSTNYKSGFLLLFFFGSGVLCNQSWSWTDLWLRMTWKFLWSSQLPHPASRSLSFKFFQAGFPWPLVKEFLVSFERNESQGDVVPFALHVDWGHLSRAAAVTLREGRAMLSLSPGFPQFLRLFSFISSYNCSTAFPLLKLCWHTSSRVSSFHFILHQKLAIWLSSFQQTSHKTKWQPTK